MKKLAVTLNIVIVACMAFIYAGYSLDSEISTLITQVQIEKAVAIALSNQ